MRPDAPPIGRLDEDVEFVLERRIEATDVGGVKVVVYSGPGYDNLNSGFVGVRVVCEYRSRVLIPGWVESNKKFIPTVMSNVIRFADYTYSPDAAPVWNLPGAFVRKDPNARR